MKLLKQLYEIHSPSGKEWGMKKFLKRYIRSHIPGCKIYSDRKGNLYVKKGRCEDYPCLVAHIDQVQKQHPKDFKAIETNGIIFGYSPKEKDFFGIGGDDKNGIWIALKAFEHFDNLKAAFFVEEEVGCRGSEQADMTFFTDCRFVLQCDRKGSHDLITQIGWTDLCSNEFIQDIEPEKFGYHEETGLMTDIETLKENGLEVSCINISCGYYNPHSDQEITVIADLQNCKDFVFHIIETATKVYPHIPNELYFRRDDDELEALMDALDYNLGTYGEQLSAEDIYEYYKDMFPTLTFDDFKKVFDDWKSYNNPLNNDKYDF